VKLQGALWEGKERKGRMLMEIVSSLLLSPEIIILLFYFLLETLLIVRDIITRN